MKTKEEFNLSEKIHTGSMLAQHNEYFFKSDVKEFIRRIKDSMIVYNSEGRDERETIALQMIIDKLAGEKLK